MRPEHSWALAVRELSSGSRCVQAPPMSGRLRLAPNAPRDLPVYWSGRAQEAPMRIWCVVLLIMLAACFHRSQGSNSPLSEVGAYRFHAEMWRDPDVRGAREDR